MEVAADVYGKPTVSKEAEYPVEAVSPELPTAEMGVVCAPVVVAVVLSV
jgi:hypothetical protein